jgi:hypothetical protein
MGCGASQHAGGEFPERTHVAVMGVAVGPLGSGGAGWPYADAALPQVRHILPPPTP